MTDTTLMGFYERVAVATGISRSTVAKVLNAAAYAVTDAERADLPEVGVEKCSCPSKGCRTFTLTIGTFYQGSGFPAHQAFEIARRINNHKQLVGALREYVYLGVGRKMIGQVTQNKARIALASAGETF